MTARAPGVTPAAVPFARYTARPIRRRASALSRPRGTEPERPDPVPHPIPGASAFPHDSISHMRLGIFRRMSRRQLGGLTLLLSMALVVIHDLPASASTVERELASELPSQELVLTEATLADSAAKVPIEPARDDIALSYYTPVQWPIDPSSNISSHFGGRASPCAGCSTYHHGIDFTPPHGTPVHAIADGVVVSRPIGGLGTQVVIEHVINGQTVFSAYGHLVSGSAAPVGTPVKMGDQIGLVGNTGMSSGTHLHLAIMVGEWNFIDPLPWMRAHVTEPWVG